MRSWREDLKVEVEGRREIGKYRESRRVRREWRKDGRRVKRMCKEVWREWKEGKGEV